MKPMWSAPRSPGSAMVASSRSIGLRRRAGVVLDPVWLAVEPTSPQSLPESLRLDPIRPMLAARDALCAPRAPSTEKEGVMPSRESLAPGAPGSSCTSTAEDWKAADPAAARDDARRAAPHPRVRGDGARPRRRGPRARPGALEHRAGGRRGRLDRRAALHGRRQRLAPRPPPVPREGAHPRHRRAARPRRARHAGGAGGAAAHPGRDPRAGPGLLPRPRRVDAPAVARGGRARHERHRRRRRARGRGQRLGAEARRHDRRHHQLLRRRRRATSARCSRR